MRFVPKHLRRKGGHGRRMLLIVLLLPPLILWGSLPSDMPAAANDGAPFEVTECPPPARSRLLERLRYEFAPTVGEADIEEAYCIDHAGLQAPEFEVALLRAGTLLEPGVAFVIGDGGEAEWVLRNIFTNRPELQPSLANEWFVRFSNSGSFDAIARYPDGRMAIIYYRD